MKVSPPNNEAQTLGVFKRLTEPAIHYVSLVLYRLLGGTDASSSVKPVKLSSQSYQIEISDEDENPNSEVIYLFTIRRNPLKVFADKQFKKIADDKYKIISNFVFSKLLPNAKALIEKFVTLDLLKTDLEHTRKRADELLHNGWVNDDIINMYMLHLSQRHKGVATISSGCNITPDFIKRLTERPQFHSDLKKNIPLARTILWPVCDNSHWYLILMTKNQSGKYDIYCFDALNSPDRNQYLHLAERTLLALLPNQDPKSLIGKKECITIPTQSTCIEGRPTRTNFVDCGPAICYWASQFAKGVDVKTIPNRGACDYGAFRFDIAQKLIEDNNKPRSRRTITID